MIKRKQVNVRGVRVGMWRECGRTSTSMQFKEDREGFNVVNSSRMENEVNVQGMKAEFDTCLGEISAVV